MCVTIRRKCMITCQAVRHTCLKRYMPWDGRYSVVGAKRPCTVHKTPANTSTLPTVCERFCLSQPIFVSRRSCAVSAMTMEAAGQNDNMCISIFERASHD